MTSILSKVSNMIVYVVSSDVYLWLFTLCLIVLIAKLIVFIFSSR